MRIADVAERVMRERDLGSVMYGDGVLTDIYSQFHDGRRHGVHPLLAMAKVLNALEWDDRFEKTIIRGHDRSGKPRPVRCFRLKAGPQTNTQEENN